MAADDVSTAALTPAQLRALFDILTHYETYSEIREFRDPAAVAGYGEPFVRPDGTPAPESAAPLLQHLFSTFVLPFVGVADLPPDFWPVSVQGILTSFADANLSESYDKGAVGTRRTITTLASATIEVVARGALGGHARHARIRGCLRQSSYDLASAASLRKAWDDVVQELVYGHLVNELFDHVQSHENLEGHSPAVEAVVQYIITHLATITHQVCVVSPEGQYMIKLLENLHKLLPYGMIRQTLRMANAATMISGIVRLFLGKLSVGAVSNWLGMTENADDGMNLLQRIVSMILSWDSSEFRKAADKTKKSQGAPTKEQLAAIEDHIKRPREEQERIRAASIEKGQSIVMAIMEATNPKMAAALATDQERHQSLLEYYSARLSVRDRDEITRVLCSLRPDLPTQALRDAVAAYDPILREIHSKVPLHEHLADLEGFITEFIETCRGKRSAADGNSSSGAGDASPPAVSDFVHLMQRNKHLLYKWLHRVAKDCPELRESFRNWCNDFIKEFRTASSSSSHAASSTADQTDGNPWNLTATRALGELGIKVDERQKSPARIKGGAGAMTPALSALFAVLPQDTRAKVVPLLDSHAAYLRAVEERATGRMQAVLDDVKRADPEGSRRSSISTTSNGSNVSNGARDSGSRLWDRNGASKNGSTAVSGAASPADVAACDADFGAGLYLARWHDLMDEALITPATPWGPPRRGRDVKSATEVGKLGAGGKVKDKDALTEDLARQLEAARLDRERADGGPRLEPPDVSLVVESLGPLFRQMLVKASARGDASRLKVNGNGAAA